MLLGIGRNGHIGFNEPFSVPQQPHAAVHARPDHAPTRPATSSAKERAAAGHHDGPGHHHGGRKILLLASGEHKANIIRETGRRADHRPRPGQLFCRNIPTRWCSWMRRPPAAN
jgi:glucosamine-6-phosphate deaminase